jgi:tetratricopeptide (TPR) repeat protein
MRIILTFILLLSAATAHHSPDEVVAELTITIEAAGDKDPILYFKRATEYRALRQYPEAAADFSKVTALEPANVSAHRSLAQVLLWQNKFAEARTSIQNAIAIANREESALCYIILAEIERADHNIPAALAACGQAFKIRPKGEIDWYLVRSELQSEAKQIERQITDLAEGYEATSSVVLHNAWIDALIDGRDFKTALPVIETQLAACRLKSSWLIRRALVREGLNRKEDADADLQQALAELNQRVHPLRPHPGLLTDRALVHFKLSQLPLARADFAKAQEIDQESWNLKKMARDYPALQIE